MRVRHERCRAGQLARQAVDVAEGFVEQNRDGQMLQLLKLELPAELQARLRSVRYYEGLPLDARTVSDAIRAAESDRAKGGA